MVTRLIVSAFLLAVACAFSACGAYIGPKESPYFKVPDGISFSMGVNNIDHVIDRKGLNVERIDSKHVEKY